MSAFSRRDFLRTASVAGFAGSFVSQSFAAGDSTEVELGRVRWLFSQSEDPIVGWLKKQLGEILRKYDKKELRIAKAAAKADIAVGTASNNSAIRLAQEKGLIDSSALGKEDFILKTVTLDGREVLLIAGGSETAACYGVFAMLERLGFRFLVSGDIYPEPADLPIPRCDEMVICKQPWRGFTIAPQCITTTSMMSLDDYEILFDQMVKMRMNKILLPFLDCDCYTDFSYQGERKLVGDISHPDSGYLSYGRFHGSYRSEDIEIGREKFGGRERIAPKELQQVKSSNEALDTVKVYMRAVMCAAKKRHIGFWGYMEPQYIPLNMSKYTRKMSRVHAHWPCHVSCMDPVADEINRNRAKTIIESYPDMEGLSVGIPEGFFDDPYPDTQKLIDERMPEYAEALEIMGQYWNKYPGWETREQQTAKIRADIAFTEICLKTLRACR